MSLENSNMNLDDLVDHQDAGFDSLLGCLMLTCRSQQIATTRDAVIAGLPLRNGKMTPALFKRAAERLNLSATILKKPLKQIRSEFLPVTLLLKDDEACKLSRLDIENNAAWVVFPELGDAESIISITELEEKYAGYFIARSW